MKPAEDKRQGGMIAASPVSEQSLRRTDRK